MAYLEKFGTLHSNSNGFGMPLIQAVYLTWRWKMFEFQQTMDSWVISWGGLRELKPRLTSDNILLILRL